VLTNKNPYLRPFLVKIRKASKEREKLEQEKKVVCGIFEGSF
jgi:hypothetical protein